MFAITLAHTASTDIKRKLKKDSSFQEDPVQNLTNIEKSEMDLRPFKTCQSRRRVSSIRADISKNLSDYQDLLSVEEICRFEAIERDLDQVYLADFRKALKRLQVSASSVCEVVTSSILFEGFVILVILANTVVLALQEPDKNYDSGAIYELELFFIYSYSVECGLKIVAKGLFTKGSGYLRDFWNLLDLTIVVTSWLELYLNSIKLNALRTLRILRPLRSISSVKGLKWIFQSLVLSAVPLIHSLVVLLVFVFLFAVAGLQLWEGLFSFRCLELEEGKLFDNCGSRTCPELMKCVKSLENPLNNTLSFDNLLISMVVVFQVITLEGWTGIMQTTQVTFGYASFLYFLPLVFIGTYIILNLSIAIIAHKFSEVVKLHKSSKNKPEMKLEEVLLPVVEAQSKQGNHLKHFVEKETISKVLSGVTEKCISLINHVYSDKILTPVIELDSYRDNNFNENVSLVIQPAVKSVATELQWRYSSQYVEFMSSEIRNSAKVSFNDTGSSFKPVKIRVRCKKISSSSFSDVLDDSEFVFTQIYCLSPEVLVKHHLSMKEKYGTESLVELFLILSQKSSKKNVFFEIFPKVKVFFNILQDEAWVFEVTLDSFSDVTKEKIIKNLQIFQNYQFWKIQPLKTLQVLRIILKKIMDSAKINYFITLLVVFNVICLSLDYYGASEESLKVLRGFNVFFTFFFLAEMILKIFSEGPAGYARDSMNLLDGAVVILNMVEFFILSGRAGTFNAFRVLRIVRIFRILKVLKMFRYLSGIVDLITIIGSSVVEFFYLFCLILLFIVVFSLLGMQIFGGNFSFEEGVPRSNFDKFHYAFVTVFQLLSMENWDSVLVSSLRFSPVSCIFLIFWIIIGNFVLLNIFLAILLQGFQNFDELALRTPDTKKTLMSSRLFKTVSSKLKEKRLREIEAKYIADSDEDFENIEINDIEDLERVLHKKTRRASKQFEGISCEKSFYLFSKTNKIRVFLYKMTTNSKFDFCILVIILLNSAKLVFDTYILESGEQSPEVRFSTVADMVFTVLFGLELVCKAVSNGFFNEEGSYLSDVWNILDFCIVVLSVVDLSLASFDISAIKVLRMLRTLRPLRFITHNITMKIIVLALFSSIFAILNVLGIMALIFLIFAILGVSLFGGKLYECSNGLAVGQTECIKNGYSWVPLFYNFDNVFESLSTLFTISSLESWPDRMYEGVDAVDIGHELVKDYNPLAAYFYIMIVVVGNFFMVNVFTAVVYDRFNRARMTESSALSFLLHKNQITWLEIQKLIIKSKPRIQPRTGNLHLLEKKLGPLINSKTFETIIILVIILNTISMAIVYEGASDSYLESLSLINDICTYIFIFEVFIKILAFGKSYFKDNWNKLDFLVVTCSVLSIILMHSISSEVSLLRVAPQLIRIIRVLRISKLFKIFKSLKSIRTLVEILIFSLPAMLNVLSLMLLIFFIFAVLGSFLFFDVKSGKVINDYFNFQNFHSSMIMLWRISTGESYTNIMIDIVDHFNSKSYILYFYSFIILTTYIFLDLFVSVIVDNYNEYHKNEESTVYLFNKVVKKFNKTWNSFTGNNGGVKIPYRQLPEFLVLIGPDLGVSKDVSHKTLLKIIASLDLELDPYGYVYYNDMLFSLMKRKYGRKLFTLNKQDLAKKYMRKEEIVAYKELSKIRLKKMKIQSRQSTIKEEKINKIRAFVSPIELKPVFDAWKMFIALKKDKRKAHRNSIMEDEKYLI